MDGDEGGIFSKAPDNPGCPNQEYNAIFDHTDQNIKSIQQVKKSALVND